MSDFEDVMALADLPPGGQITAQVGAVRVLLCHDAGTGAVRALQDECPHAFMPLAGGRIRDGAIQCPKHGACFDLASGKPLNTVTTRTVTVYPVLIERGRIFVARAPAGV